MHLILFYFILFDLILLFYFTLLCFTFLNFSKLYSVRVPRITLNYIAPLGAKGHYEPQDEEVEAAVNPCFHNSSTSNIAGVGVPTMSSPVAVSASFDVASIPKGRTVVRRGTTI